MPPSRSESLIYLSERKLWNLARGRRISTASSIRSHRTTTGRVQLRVAPGTRFDGEVRAERERVDPQHGERAIERVLERVVDALQEDGLADLDAGTHAPADGGWFRFHRHLRFGYGCDDDARSVSALILVDREPVETCGQAGLLMNGSPWHLREPYRPDEQEQIQSARSGSGTGRLFRWLENVRERREADETIRTDEFDDPQLFQHDPSSHGPPEPIGMYQLFASDGWMVRPRFAQLLDYGPCEGIAQASLVSAHDQIAVVMASPLYVRILRPSRDESTDESLVLQRKRRFGMLQRT